MQYNKIQGLPFGNTELVEKFKQLVKKVQTEKIIDSKEIRGFKVLAKTKKYTGAKKCFSVTFLSNKI